MIEVHRADTGHFVLTHRATDTVVVSEDLAAGYARIEPALREAAKAPPALPGASHRSARWPWLLVALLPFVWLVVLHASLGRLIGELAVKLREPAAEPAASKRELEELRLDLGRLEAQLAAPTPASPRPRPPAPEPAAEDDEDEPAPAPVPITAAPASEPDLKDRKKQTGEGELKNPFKPPPR